MKETRRIFNKNTGKIEKIPMNESYKHKTEIAIGQNNNPISKSFLIESFNKGFVNFSRRDLRLQDCFLPRKRLDKLLTLYEENTMHSRCIDLKTDLTVGLGCGIVNLSDTPNQKEIDILKLLKLHPNTDKLGTFRKMIWAFTRDFYATGNAFLELVRSKIDGSLLSWRYRPAHRIFKSVSRKGYWFFFDLQNPNERRYINAFDDVDDKTANELYQLIRPDPKSDFYGLMQAFSAIRDMGQVDFTKRHLSAWYRNNATKIKGIFIKPGIYDMETFNRDIKRLHENSFSGVDNWYKTWLAEIEKGDINTLDFQDQFDEEKITKLLKMSQAEIALANGVPLSILDYFDKSTVMSSEAMRSFLQMSISPNQELIQTDLFNIFNITDNIEESMIEFKKFDTTTTLSDVGSLSQLLIILEKLVNIPQSQRGDLGIDEIINLIRDVLESSNIKGKVN